jgi:hypothetical protein
MNLKKAAAGVAASALLGFGTLAGAVTLAGSASAAETHSDCVTFGPPPDFPILSVTPNCSQTVAMAGGDTQSQPDVNPCDPADTGTFSMTPNRSVFHVNVNGDGDLWVTGTTNGTAAFVPDNPGDVSATGSFANWFGVELNNKNFVNTFTTTVAMHLSNGQTAIFHEIGHVTLTPNGATLSFDKAGGACHG